MAVELGPRAKGVLIPSSKTVCTGCETAPGDRWKAIVDEYGVRRYQCPSCSATYCRKPNLPPRRAYKDTRAMGLVCGECRYWLKAASSGESAAESAEPGEEKRFCVIFQTLTEAHYACSVFERPIESAG